MSTPSLGSAMVVRSSLGPTKLNPGGVKDSSAQGGAWEGCDQIQPAVATPTLGGAQPVVLTTSPPTRIEALLIQGPGCVLFPAVISGRRMPGTEWA